MAHSIGRPLISSCRCEYFSTAGVYMTIPDEYLNDRLFYFD